MAVTPHDSVSPTTFSFGGTSFTVTNIVVTNTDPSADNAIDVSHLGLTVGNSILTQTRPLQGSAANTGREVMIDYLGSSIIRDASTGTLSLTINGSNVIGANATVSSSTLTLATNDVIKGQVTFKVARY
jgi:hypothetical protein